MLAKGNHKFISHNFPFLITSLVVIFVTFQFFLQGAIGIFSDLMKKDLDLDAAAVSLLSSSFFYSYILLQVPAGIIIDRLALRKVIPFTVLGLSCSCLLLSFCTHVKYAIIIRIIMGVF